MLYAKYFSTQWKAAMNKSEHPASTSRDASSKPAQQIDYAAWVDSEGQEHPITHDMVDATIEELVSGPDYSLQGRTVFNPERGTVRYSQTHPH